PRCDALLHAARTRRGGRLGRHHQLSAERGRPLFRPVAVPADRLTTGPHGTRAPPAAVATGNSRLLFLTRLIMFVTPFSSCWVPPVERRRLPGRYLAPYDD